MASGQEDLRLGMQIDGVVPDTVSAPMRGTTAFFYRYELVDGRPVRRRVGERRRDLAVETRLVDVLLNEDEAGRYLNVVRGIVVSERDLADIDAGAGVTAWREFDVSLDLMLAIGRDLGVGPHRPLRLVAVDGKRVTREAGRGR